MKPKRSLWMMILFVLLFWGYVLPLRAIPSSGAPLNEGASSEKKTVKKAEPAESQLDQGTKGEGKTSGLAKLRIPSLGFSFGPGLRLGDDDLDNFRLGEKGYLAALPTQYYDSDFDWEKMRWGRECEVKLYHPVFRFPLGKGSLRTGVMMGAGWSRYKNEGTYTINHELQNFWDESHNWDYNHVYTLKNTQVFMDAKVGMRLPGLKSFPGSPGCYGYFGCGLNFGKLTHDTESEYDANFVNGDTYYFNESRTENEVVKDFAFGIRYGLGTNLRITKFLGLGLEFYGRHTKFDDWEGERTYDTSWDDNGSTGSITNTYKGKLWHYKGTVTNAIVNTYTNLEVLDQEPDSSYMDVRPAEIKLNRIGVRLNLNLRLSGLNIKF